MKLLTIHNNLSFHPRVIEKVRFINPVNLAKKRLNLRFSQNKLACKSLGITLSAIIVLIFTAILFNAGLPSVASVLAFSTIVFSLVLLNIVYLKLIDNLFAKLNNRRVRKP